MIERVAEALEDWIIDARLAITFTMPNIYISWPQLKREPGSHQDQK